ncbi:MAG: hypothetical protein K2F88_08690 [Duncaniella sp.]|nr:hypothetical protein [Duncaniella sp.]
MRRRAADSRARFERVIALSISGCSKAKTIITSIPQAFTGTCPRSI